MEDYGYKYIYKLPQFVTTSISIKICSIDLKLKDVKKSDFLSILYSKSLREYRKAEFTTGGRVRISEYGLPFRKRYKSQFTPEVFETVAIASRKPPKSIIKDDQDEIIHGKFNEKGLNEVM